MTYYDAINLRPNLSILASLELFLDLLVDTFQNVTVVAQTLMCKMPFVFTLNPLILQANFYS